MVRCFTRIAYGGNFAFYAAREPKPPGTKIGSISFFEHGNVAIALLSMLSLSTKVSVHRFQYEYRHVSGLRSAICGGPVKSTYLPTTSDFDGVFRILNRVNDFLPFGQISLFDIQLSCLVMMLSMPWLCSISGIRKCCPHRSCPRWRVLQRYRTGQLYGASSAGISLSMRQIRMSGSKPMPSTL